MWDYLKLYQKSRLPLLDFVKFKKNQKSGSYITHLFGNKFLISNPYWFLHSVQEIFVDEIYDFSFNNSKPVIIDCGANWGLSILYFKKKFPEATITAFEADPTIFNLLKENLETNELVDVELINKAVWSDDTSLQFSSDGALGGTLSSLNINDRPTNTYTVDAVSLKPYLLRKSVDFLKIDIEGAEFEVLNSCADALSNVSFLFIEYHSTPQQEQLLPELIGIIKNAGFRFYIKEAWNNMEHPFKENRKDLYYDLQLNIFCYR